MSDQGFIVIDRCMLEWRWFENAIALQLWMYILLKANWKDKWTSNGSELVGRGELIVSVDKIAALLDVNRKTIRRYLKLFEQDGQIRIEADNRRTKIIVINYAKYQDVGKDNGLLDGQPSGQPDGQLDGQPDGHNRTNKQSNNNNQETNKEEKVSKDTSKKKAELLDDWEYWFEKFWNLYPRKQGKQTAMKAFNKVCKNEEAYLLIEAGLLRVIPEWKKDDPKYTPLPATWLNGRRWEDEPLTPAAGQSILELLNEFDKEEEEEPHEDE